MRVLRSAPSGSGGGGMGHVGGLLRFSARGNRDSLKSAPSSTYEHVARLEHARHVQGAGGRGCGGGGDGRQTVASPRHTSTKTKLDRQWSAKHRTNTTTLGKIAHDTSGVDLRKEFNFTGGGVGSGGGGVAGVVREKSTSAWGPPARRPTYILPARMTPPPLYDTTSTFASRQLLTSFPFRPSTARRAPTVNTHGGGEGGGGQGGRKQRPFTANPTHSYA